MTLTRLVALLWLVALAPLTANARREIPLEVGNTTLTAKAAGLAAVVVLRIVTVPTDSPTLVGGRTEADGPITKIVQNVSIKVNGEPVFTSLSAYADLRNPSDAELHLRGGRGTLTIRGGDGSESYRVVIEFNRIHVSRRRVFSTLDNSQIPGEDTTYRLHALKDQP
jgi:hypothetical protein